MGCASSTPMIAGASNDMLKAATNAASDAAKSAEDTVQDMAQTLGKTVENAKETVGNAVTGIAHDIGHVIVEKTEALDDAKNQLLGRLHLGGDGMPQKAIEAADASVHKAEPKAVDILMASASRAPTPAHDLDSLKTCTPEPEIEQALANAVGDSPPTPRPTLSELEKLKADVRQNPSTTGATSTMMEKAVQQTNVSTAGAAASVAEAITTNTTTAMIGATADKQTANEPAVDSRIAWLSSEKRPSTTEWEKYTDLLSRNRKLNPYEVFKGGGFGALSGTVISAGAGTRGAAAGGGKFRRFGPPTHPRDYPKPSETVQRSLREDDSCMSDAYYNSLSSPQHSSNSNSPKVRRARLPTNSVLATNAKRMQREFATYMSGRRPLGAANNNNVNAYAFRSQNVSPTGRHFDYNPQRSRYGAASPTSPLRKYGRPRNSSPVLVNPDLLPQSRTAIRGAPVIIGTRASRGITRIGTPPAKTTRAFAKSKVNYNKAPAKTASIEAKVPTPPKPKPKVIESEILPQSTKLAKLSKKPTTPESISKKADKPPEPTKSSPFAGFSLSRALKPLKMAAKSQSKTAALLIAATVKDSPRKADASSNEETPSGALNNFDAKKVISGSTNSSTTNQNFHHSLINDENAELREEKKVNNHQELKEPRNPSEIFNTLMANNSLPTKTNGGVMTQDNQTSQQHRKSKLQGNADSVQNMASMRNSEAHSPIPSTPSKSSRSSTSVIIGSNMSTPDTESDTKTLVSAQNAVVRDIVADNANGLGNGAENYDIIQNVEIATDWIGDVEDAFSENENEVEKIGADEENMAYDGDADNDDDADNVDDAEPDYDAKHDHDARHFDNVLQDDDAEHFDDLDPEEVAAIDIEADNDDDDDGISFKIVDVDNDGEGQHYPTTLYTNHSTLSLDQLHRHTHHAQYLDMSRSNTVLSMNYRSPLHTPMRNTSSFLSTPRSSPFSVHKSFSIYNDNNGGIQKESFVADLSSVAERRASLTPSPYKIRARCAVCFKKYVIT